VSAPQSDARKLRHGERANCARCGQDLEWVGYWWDRGGNRECPPYQRRGEIVTLKGLKHTLRPVKL